jgi:hypothetical protein
MGERERKRDRGERGREGGKEGKKEEERERGVMQSTKLEGVGNLKSMLI